MKTRLGALGVSLFCAVLWGGLDAGQVTIARTAARMESLGVGETTLAFPDDRGGFRVIDAQSKRDIPLPDGLVKPLESGADFSCEKPGDIRIHAEFVPHDHYILVTGEVENLRDGERGIILDYGIPLKGPDPVFSNDLNTRVKLDGAAEHEGNVYPIAALSDGETSLAMAIPPSEPRVFGMLGGGNGLVVRFYLGLSPMTRRFPNRASFVFVIYPVDSAWGFRSALEKYYGFYPDYYETRVKRFGAVLVAIRGSAVVPDMEHYANARIDFNQADEEFARNKKYHLQSQLYLNPGTVALGNLSEIPGSVEEAMAVFNKLCGSTSEEWTAGGPDPDPCELISDSACGSANGTYAMVLRYSPGQHNQIAFKTNPSPYLFDGKKGSVGKQALLTEAKWMAKYPDSLDAVSIDSLGANWPAVLNYRQDHFEYARYPLTCDPSGRPAIHNTTSYYELLDALRTRLRVQGKFLFGNGMYNYYTTQRGPPEHYRGAGVEVGRFFIAALLDRATSESGIKAEQDRIEYCRVAMCRKPYTLTNSHWSDEDYPEMIKWFNKTLVYDVCGSNQRIYSETGGPTPYYPKGYNRDKKLIDWYMDKEAMLWQAGWRPVTDAKVAGDGLLLERYGDGGRIYFTVLSETDKPRTCVLTVSLKALRIEAGRYTVSEVSGQAAAADQGEGRILLQLKPHRTCIVALERSEGS